MKFQALSRHLASEPPLPCYAVYGDDAFLREKAVVLFREKITACPELNLSVFGDTSSPSAIIDACELLPVMSDLRVVIVNWGTKDFAAFSNYLKNPNPACMLVFAIEGGAPKDLPAAVTAVDCRKLDRSSIIKWLGRNADIAHDAAALVCEYCGDSMARISTELAKLSAYAAGGRIDADAVRLLVEPEAEYQIYALADAAARGNGALAFKIADKCTAAKIPPSTLISSMYNHFRRLFYVRLSGGGETTASRLGVKPYAAEAARKQSAAFTPVRLKKILDLFSKYDLAIKNGTMNDYSAFILLINAIISLRVS